MTRKQTGLLLVMPATAVLLALFVAPLLYSLWISLHEAFLGQIKPGLTLVQYKTIFTQPIYLDALQRTFKLSLFATVLALLVGYPLAFALAFRLRRLAAVLTLVILAPLLMNVVVRTLGWVLILGRNGVVSTAGRWLGLGEVQLLYTEAAVLIGYVQVFLPFMVLSILASLQTIDTNLFRASASLGASPVTTFFTVLLPLSLPGVLSGSVIVLSLSSGVFVLPAMLGGSDMRVLSLLAYKQTTTTLNYPLGAASAFVLLAILMIIITCATLALERSRFREVFRRASV